MSFKKKSVPISGRANANPESSILSHEGVKASVQTSHPTISTGSENLDSLLGHNGLPLGSMLLVEETGATDFSSVLLRSFASQGILHQRLPQGGGSTRVVVVGQDETWGKELPGLYVDKKQKKMQKVEEEESKVTVSNKNMKIAWRYSRSAEIEQRAADSTAPESTKQHYNATFDFTSRLIPSPNPNEITYINPTSLASLIVSLEKIIKESTLVRIVFPSFLHPVIFPPACSSPKQLMPFFHLLHGLCKKYPYSVSMVMSLPLDLYPRHSAVTRWAEHQSDGVIQLDPFPESLESQSQGLVNVFKIPVTSERGVMVSKRGEYAFRVGKKTFEIRDFGIPVDESEQDNTNTNNNSPSIDY